MNSKSYTISYERINELTTLARTLPVEIFNQSPYFFQVKDLFWRIDNLEVKYKTLIKQIKSTEMEADKLVSLLNTQGMTAVQRSFKGGKHGFSSMSYGSDQKTVHFGTKKIDTALQDYVTRYSEILETSKYFIANQFNDYLEDTDSFSGYVNKSTPQNDELFSFDYLIDFNRYLWNEQKHSSDIGTSAISNQGDILKMPLLRSRGRFNCMNIEEFLDESIENLTKLFKFIHSFPVAPRKPKDQQGEWLISFKGKKNSYVTNVNFVWKHSNIYISDNHRVAMWGWLQQIDLTDLNRKYDLCHIDRHTDTLYANMASWLQDAPKLEGLTLEEYLALEQKVDNYPLIRYDNYLSIFLERYEINLDSCWFFTHGEGDKPQWNKLQTPPAKSLVGSLDYWIENSPNQSIINIDIDFFLCDDKYGNKVQMFTDGYIRNLGMILKKQLATGKIAVVTIALSPEWSGGWDKARRLCSVLTKAMGVDFDLKY